METIRIFGCCEECGVRYHPIRKKQRFCSRSCASKWRSRELNKNCEDENQHNYKVMMQTLEETKYNITMTAKILGITTVTLYKRLRIYGINDVDNLRNRAQPI